MSHSTLVCADQLQSMLAAATPCVVLDCGFDLADTTAGEQAYARGHLPGAVYAHLDRHLSGAKTGRNGRHPLPARDVLAATVGGWGVAPGVQVVAYDDQAGPYAARAWWLLRWLGHADVAVLDGGRAAWLAIGGALGSEPVTPVAQAPYPAGAPAMATIAAAALQARLGQLCLLDARSGERFRGEVEPLDPVAGHIPGASCRFFKDNLQADGCYKPPAQLREEFMALGAVGGEVVHQCGSGVTACHNLLAMAHAGLAAGALYAGSWSEWCSDPARPVAKG
jgi:thiosulfate/3-mercaptopyruvate sulfurtransferase